MPILTQMRVTACRMLFLGHRVRRLWLVQLSNFPRVVFSVILNDKALLSPFKTKLETKHTISCDQLQVKEPSGRKGSLSAPSCASQGWGLAALSTLPAAASCLAVRSEESILMASAGFHKWHIQGWSHLLKPQG